MNEIKNPLFEAYLKEKEIEKDYNTQVWARELFRHYKSYMEAGFTSEQAIQLVERLWIQVDLMEWRKSGLSQRPNQTP